jgi:hypothetical protein
MMSTTQANSNATIQLPPPSAEQIAGFAVWRVDYYICTCIAYAKSLGKTVEELINYVGNAHDWEDMRGKGVVPPVQFLYFLIMNYKNGEFEILSESDNSIRMRFNRPYVQFFANDPMLGVSIEEFESFLWDHIAIMAKRIDLNFIYQVEGETISATLSQSPAE